jgi:hypothetical protein
MYWVERVPYHIKKIYNMKKTKSSTPQILLDVLDYLKTNKLVAEAKVNGEGRMASLKDEETIIEFLKKSKKFSKYIIEVEARKAGDFYLLDYDKVTIHIVNIKTTKGSTDNATCKIGFLWAFTDMELDELPGNITLKIWNNLMKKRKANIPNRDYWYLTFDKRDMSKVFLRGAKQIVNWKYNPSNFLQIDWKMEWETKEQSYSFDESYSNIMDGMKECIRKKLVNSYPIDWVKQIAKTIK